MLKLYENIRRLRNEQGMTQVDLADAAGYTSILFVSTKRKTAPTSEKVLADAVFFFARMCKKVHPNT